MQHVLITRGNLSAVKFEVDCGTAEVEAFLLENGLCAGSTDDLLSFRASSTDRNEFLPMVALDSEIQDGKKKLVAFVQRGGDPDAVLLRPKEKLWGKGTWFICKKIEPLYIGFG